MATKKLILGGRGNLNELSYNDSDFVVIGGAINLVAVSSNSSIIGEIRFYDKSFPNTPALSAEWKECDGSVINDIASPYNGYRIRNLNGNSIVLLNITWINGIATIPSIDVTALAIGQSITGVGIAANTKITNIIGTTVTISDLSFSATIDTTFISHQEYLRGSSSSGTGHDQQIVKHKHDLITTNPVGGLRASNVAGTNTNAFSGTLNNIPPYDLQINGVIDDTIPITSGNENKPYSIEIVYIMRIK